MSQDSVVQKLLEAEEILKSLQSKNATRASAIALTHLETAKLWLMKEWIEDSYKVVNE
jgi:hypothetical protein